MTIFNNVYAKTLLNQCANVSELLVNITGLFLSTLAAYQFV